MEPTAINKQNSRPQKSVSQGPKSPSKHPVLPQSAPKQKLNFLDLTHEKRPNNSKNQVISLASTSEEQPAKQRGASPGTHKRLNFELDEASARKFARLKKLQNAGFQSPSSSFQKSNEKSGKLKIRELLKEKGNRRSLKFRNEILRDFEDILENHQKYKVDLTVTGEDLNMEGHREESESVCSYDESTSSTREYCVYEDWKLIEAAEQYKGVTGKLKGPVEPRIWAEMIDPETNRKLLEGRRDSKSMTKRYTNYLIYLNQEEILAIQGMAKALTSKELKRLKIAFRGNKQGDGKKELAYIYKNVKGKIDRLSSGTLNGFCEIAQEVIVVHSGETKSDEIEEVDIEEIIRPEVTAKSSVSEDISNFNDSQLSFSARKKSRRLNENNPPDDIINVDDEEEDDLFKNNKAGMKKIKGNNGKETIVKNPLQERVSSSTLAGGEEVKYPKRVQDEIIKKRRKNWEYDKKSLIASKKFESRRGTRKFNFDANLCLFVDLEHQFRQFVKTDNEVIIDEEEGDLIGNQLSVYASEYGCTLQEIGDLFKKASCNLKELEKYLKTKNVNILWNSQEDEDLRQDNSVALRYLVRTKGADRIKERRMYLKKVDRRHTNVVISD